MPKLDDGQIEANFQAIADEARANGGALTVSERRIRESFGYGRWDPNLVPLVEPQLTRAGLRLFPGERLRRNQKHEVLLYLTRSPLARLIEFVEHPASWALDRFLGDIRAAADALREPGLRTAS